MWPFKKKIEAVYWKPNDKFALLLEYPNQGARELAMTNLSSPFQGKVNFGNAIDWPSNYASISSEDDFSLEEAREAIFELFPSVKFKKYFSK